MAKRQVGFKTKGMNRDLSVSSFDPEVSFENRNLRLGTNEANTTMSWVTERGTASVGLRNVEYWSKRYPNSDYIAKVYKDPEDSSWTHHSADTEDVEITGTPIGTAVINHRLVIFTTDTLHDHDYIYVLTYIDNDKDSMYCKTLFGDENMSLGFDVAHPIETLVSYESETIQKVYWTDGKNQPRVVNIEGTVKKENNTQFDFVPTLQLQEDISVKKLLGASGMFAPGVIQYAFTYYTKFGQESNIFYTSPLIYISYRDRGASPEDKVENAFQITVRRIDANFDYLRIYSIQRTSINATPICKRIQDIAIEGLEEGDDGLQASYIDTGTSGDSIDPTELLYKGGETISALTEEQKDNTLFFGNISITRPQIADSVKESIKETSVSQSTRQIHATLVSTGSYVYSSQLTAFNGDGSKSVPCAGFKYGDTYRLGVQFQYKTGKWSDPVWIKDESVSNKPTLNSDNTVITLPALSGTIPAAAVSSLVGSGYMKARALVVFPGVQDRNVICQGVVNPTMFTQEHRNNGDLYAQSSWFFRASYGNKFSSSGTASPANNTGVIPYTHYGIGTGVPNSRCTSYNPKSESNNIRLVEIQGDYESNNKFQISREYVTFHSPDIEFDTQMDSVDYSNFKYRQVGYSQFIGTMSDIDIQTETPAVSSLGGGFVHKSFKDSNTYGIVAGLFYEDCCVDDNWDVEGKADMASYSVQGSPCKWMVYPWHKKGSLNNDCNRPSNMGTQTAILKKKVISNLRFANTYYDNEIVKTFSSSPQIFSGNEVSILKFNNNIYMGNIDTMLIPDNNDGLYFAFSSSKMEDSDFVNTSFTSDSWWKTFSKSASKQDESGLYKFMTSSWSKITKDIGDDYIDLVMKKDPVRMKYKSTSHLVFSDATLLDWCNGDTSKANSLPIVEIYNAWTSESAEKVRFGGESLDALKENIWIPCGEPVLLTSTDDAGQVTVRWDYGDTYFQRWDCLKTYPFTNEDPNQIVEIGSFMLETRTNIDGRYDRNRGQMNNLNMSPQNFNLLNPVYSQTDNFFQYRIQDDFYYKDTEFPNQITWTKTKTSGADVDLWTNITLANILELDGDKGKVSCLKRYNDTLLCFQDSGFSQILYNDNVMVNSSNGVPIEIANSDKVQGKRYLSDTVGCSDKWSVVSGISGIFFIDSNSRSIYLFNGSLDNISLSKGFNAWSKTHIPSYDVEWNPIFPLVNEQSAFVAYCDRMNQEVMFINNNYCLAYSEKFGLFTSFYDYHNTPYFCNLDDTGIWLRANQVWKHQAGDYCKFFGAPRPYSMILVGNPEPTMTKQFTNLDFRAHVDGDGEESYGVFTPYLPFDTLDTWNEYQHGIAYLSYRRGSSAMKHHTADNEASLKRKFRTWYCDIPRDNGDNLDTFDETFDDTFHPLARLRKHPLDRMSNPWIYIRLRKEADDSLNRTEIHNVVMTYFI